MEPVSFKKEMILGLSENATFDETKEKFSLHKYELFKSAIVRQLASLSAGEIRLISTKIVERVLSNLGPIGTARVALKTNPKIPRCIAISPKPKAMSGIENGAQFFSQENRAKFGKDLLESMEASLTEIFSSQEHAEKFPLYGIIGKLSDSRSEGVLKKVAEKIGIALSPTDVPPDYSVNLKLEVAKSVDKEVLVFTLTQGCTNVEFSKETFTIADLEKQAQSFQTQS